MIPCDPHDALAQCRADIDTVDRRIVEMLNERTLIVERIGSIKQSFKMPIYEPKREEEVYLNIHASNRGPMPADDGTMWLEIEIQSGDTITVRGASFEWAQSSGSEVQT